MILVNIYTIVPYPVTLSRWNIALRQRCGLEQLFEQIDLDRFMPSSGLALDFITVEEFQPLRKGSSAPVE
jgi:hypothetical protein